MHINRQNQSTTGKLWNTQWPCLSTGISKEMVGWIRFWSARPHTLRIEYQRASCAALVSNVMTTNTYHYHFITYYLILYFDRIYYMFFHKHVLRLHWISTLLIFINIYHFNHWVLVSMVQIYHIHQICTCITVADNYWISNNFPFEK
jgi:hypothetical protein